MSRRSRTIIIICLGVAFLLRIWGFDFGLPYDFHPDEHQYVDNALRWHTSGQMELSFANPPLFTYILTAGLWFWMQFSPYEPTPAWLTGAYLFARWWSIAFGVLTIALMYPLGKRFSGQRVGLVSCILLTALFLPAREAHFAVNDALVTFFTVLSLYFSLKLFQTRQRLVYIQAGAAVGLTAASKLTGGVVVLAVLVAHALTTARSKTAANSFFTLKAHRYLGLSLLVAGATFALISFHMVWNLPRFIQRLNDLLVFGREGFYGAKMGPGTGWAFYVDVFGWGMGWPLFFTALIALVVSLWQRQPQGGLLASLPLALFAALGAQKAFSARYLLPAIPPLVVFAAVGLVWLASRWPFFGRHRWVMWPLLLGIGLAQPLTNLVWFNHLLTQPDTRALATAWFTEAFPQDTVVVKEFYGLMPNIVFTNKHWPYKIISLDKLDANRNERDYYLAHKTELIAISNYVYDRRLQDAAAEAGRQAQLAFLEEQATLLKTFDPYLPSYSQDFFYLDQLYGPARETLQRRQPGPLIKIYRLPYDKQPYSVEVPPISVPVQANFGGKLMLLGYDLPVRRAEPGEGLPVTLYWQVLTRMDEIYVVFNRLLDREQQVWGGYDRWPLETAKTTLWHPNEVVVDTFNLPVAADAPDGVYTIDIGLYRQDDPQALPLPLIHQREPIDQNSIRLGPVKVGGPDPDVTLEAPSPRNPLLIKLGDPATIALRGYDLDLVDEALRLKLYWESLAQTSVDWTTFVHLRSETGQVVAQKDGPTGNERYPTSLWDAGDVIADEVMLPLPDQASASYRLVIGLYNLTTGQRLVVPGYADNEIILTEQSW